jgi:hypothetical protein
MLLFCFQILGPEKNQQKEIVNNKGMEILSAVMESLYVLIDL